MEIDPILRHIKTLIDRKDEIQAKAQLLEVLGRDPNNAQGWWLASQLSDNNADARALLEKALNIDPTHSYALRDLKKLIAIEQNQMVARSATPSAVPTPSSKPAPGKPVPKGKTGSQGGEQPSPLALALYQYQQKGWKIERADKNKQAVISKMTGLSWTLAFILGAFFPPLIFANLFLRRKREIFLKEINGVVEVSGAVRRTHLDVRTLQSKANLPMPDVPYLRAFGYGIGLMILLCAGLTFLAANADLQVNVTPTATEYSPNSPLGGGNARPTATDISGLPLGAQVYLVPEAGQTQCISVFANPDDLQAQDERYSQGYGAQIVDRLEIDGVLWYQLQGINPPDVIGWVDETKVSTRLPARRIPLSACQ